MNNKKILWSVLGVIGLALLWLDRYVKTLAVKYLASGDTKPGIAKIFDFVYVENRGAAFGILQDARWYLVAITVLMIAALWVFVFTNTLTKKSFVFLLSVVLVTAGGIGNLIDRIVQGYVVDYIHLLFMDFPCFNIADICVCIGMLLLLCISILQMPDKKRSNENNG